jgi:FK506-binding protein 4/5
LKCSLGPPSETTGDGGILKKITKEGEGWATPREADEVLGNIDSLVKYFK